MVITHITKNTIKNPINTRITTTGINQNFLLNHRNWKSSFILNICSCRTMFDYFTNRY